MISENNTVREQIIERCLMLNERIKQLQTLFTFDDLDESDCEISYMMLLKEIADLNYTNYKTIKEFENSKEQYKLTHEIIARHEKSSHGEQIMVNCLKVDASLKTVHKALNYDENEVDGFYNDYLYILENAIETNWKNHNVAEEVSIEEFHKIISTNK